MLLLSYLFPGVSMLDFIIGFMAICVLASVTLFYFFLKKNGYSRNISFLCSFLLLCAAPFIFHSARHIMFVSYMPFLILGLYGVDRYVEKKRSFLLILSISLMIFTSYYFSIPGMVALFVYGLFKYVRKNGFRFKTLLYFGAKSAFPYLVAVLICAILILPTFAVFMMGRSDNVSTVSLLALFTPKRYMLNSSYAMGLTYACLAGCICMLFSKRIENRILSAFLLLICTFPFFNYLLNVLIYISAKVLIPFIPLTLINMADFLTLVSEKLKKLPKASLKTVLRVAVCMLLVVTSLYTCLRANTRDTLITRDRTQNEITSAHRQMLESQVQENGLYRVNTSYVDEVYINRVMCTHDLKTSVYSSIFNGNYRRVYRELFENPLYDRNEFYISASANLIFRMYMGEKYIFSKESPGFMYQSVGSVGDITLYQNPYALPIGYVTDRYIEPSDFSALSYPDAMLNLLGTAVVGGKNTTVSFNKVQPLSTLDYTVVKQQGLQSQQSENGYTVTATNDAALTLKLQDEILLNKLILVDFSLKAQSADLSISINGITNTLTAKDWKYYNQNERFAYVIPNANNTLEISFIEGVYEIEAFSVSVLDFDLIKDIYKEIDPFTIDSVSGDTMKGSVNATKDGVFLLSVPYDKGFTVYVDGKKTEYYLANEAFIGFDVQKGEHEIVLSYHAPLKTEGLAISGLGIALCAAVSIYENRKKEEETWN